MYCYLFFFIMFRRTTSFTPTNTLFPYPTLFRSGPADLADKEILERLVALNHARAAEERAGRVRWLRPEFQAPKAAVAARRPQQVAAELVAAEDQEQKPKLPAALPAQVAAIRVLLAGEIGRASGRGAGCRAV